MHRWLIQTTGKKEKPSLETKQGERIEGTQLKQQINVLECWRGKKKCPGFDTAQSSLPRYFQACKLTRFFLGGLACIIHTGGPPDGQQMLLHRQPSTYFYICLVCVWCACVCPYMWLWTRTWHGTRLELLTFVHLVWRAFVFSSADTRLSWPVGFWEFSHFCLPSHTEPLELLTVHIATPCCYMGADPHAYVASTSPTEPSPQPCISGL